MIRVKPEDLIRMRRRADEEWSYARVIRQDESGLIHYAGDDGRMRSMASVDAEWKRSRGDLEIRRR